MTGRNRKNRTIQSVTVSVGTGKHQATISTVLGQGQAIRARVATFTGQYPGNVTCQGQDKF
jgi:hypothetical protein